MIEGSQGWITIERLSGMDTEATWVTGVGAP